MPRGSFAPFLTFIRARRRAADADADLLARFAADGDEDAFAELVRRHGPMVWGVARQVLGHDQDAEDAFQATFLLLSRNAARIRTAAAVAGWLHGTAWRVATKAKSRAVVRQRREQAVSPKTNGDVVADVTLRELQAILHAEIAALPSKYRTPFVLCVLEGRGRSEVAKSLGWNEGTLSTRLAWARQRLRSRLLRRGVDVSAALAAIEVTRDATAALPAALAHSTVAAARTGIVSAAVAALAHGGLMTSKFAPLAALGLVLGVIAVGTAGLMGSDPPAAQPPAKDKPAPQPAAAPDGRPTGTCSLTVTGTATGADGQPLAGATLFITVTNRGEKPLATVKTDAKGRYEFKDLALPMAASIRVRTLPNPDSIPNMAFQISGIADGMAVEWIDEIYLPIKSEATGQAGEVRNVVGPATVDLKFGPSAHFQGRLVDDKGQPVAGAKIHMTRCDHLSTPPKPLSPGVLHGLLRTGCLPEDRTMTTSGPDGRFRINGVPADAIAHFTIKHPDYADLSATASLVDPKTVKQPSRISTLIPRNGNGFGGKIIVGDIDLTLQSPRSLAVEVVSSTTGKPVANAHVSIGPLSVNKSRGAGLPRPADQPTSRASGTTDAAGKLALRMPAGLYTLTAYAPNRVPGNSPPANSTYYGSQEQSVVIGEKAEQSLTVRLEPACKINLEIVEAGTGKPIAGQSISVQMEHGNIPGLTRGAPGQPRVPVVDWRRVDGGPNPFPQTDADGKATTWANPGKGRIQVNGQRRDQYEPFETAEPMTLEPAGEVKLRVELRKKDQPAAPPAPAAAPKPPTVPVTITGIATGPDRKPVKDATIYLLALDGTNAPVIATTKTDEKGAYAFRDAQMPLPTINVQKGKPPMIVAQVNGTSPGLAIGWRRAIFHVLLGRPPEPRQVDLIFTKPVELAGRVVNENGRPMPDVNVRLYTDGGDNTTGDMPDTGIATQTGPDGRWRLGGMPDGTVQLLVTYPDYPQVYVFSNVTEQVPNWTFPKKGEPIDVTLARPRTIPVRVVANSTGEPVKNLRIALAKTEGIWIVSFGTTDAAGRAELKMPPGEYHIDTLLLRGSPYLKPAEKVTVTETPAEQPLTIRLLVGCTVEVEAVDADTKFPLRHVRFEKASVAKPDKWWGLSDDASRDGDEIAIEETDKWGKLTTKVRPGKWLIRPQKPFIPVDEVKPIDLPDASTVKLRIAVREKE